MSSAIDITADRTGPLAVADAQFAWRVGFLLGLPFAVPAPPLYLIGFACFLFSLPRFKLRLHSSGNWRELGIITLIIIALLSNLAALSRYNIDLMRIITTSFFFLLFIFPSCIADKRSLLLGFCQVMLVWAALIILMAINLRIWDYGLLLFSVPNFRLWGAEIFPDWPNYMAFMLSFAFLLNAIVFGRPWQAGLLFFAALLTTSRTPLIALGLLLTAWVIFQLMNLRLGKLMAFGCTLIVSLLILLIEVDIDPLFLERLMIIDDRDDIYSFALGLFQQSLWIGHGSVLLDESIGFNGHPSFHNSYLDIAVRHGLPALLIFLLLLAPPRAGWHVGGLNFAAVVLFVLVGSMFQNFLKHPHILMLYVVLIESSSLFRKPRRGI